MLRRPGRILLFIGLALLAALLLGRLAVGFYTDVLWHGELGYLPVFWRRLLLGLGVRGVAAVLGAALVFLNLWLVTRHLGPVRVRRRYGNLEIAERIPRRNVLIAAGAVAALGGWWLAELQFDDSSALHIAAWLRHAEFGVAEPFFGLDAAFYVFTLPVLANASDFLILAAVWSIALVALGHVLVGGVRWDENRLVLSRPARLHLAALVAAMLVLLALRYVLGRYTLIVEGNGIGGGLGYTDVDARLPAHWIMAALSLLAAAALVYGAWRRSLVPPVVGLGALIAGGLLAGTAWPAAVQKFRVEPNELSREAPFIRWNIEFTRAAYGVDALDRRRFPYRRDARPAEQDLEAVLDRLPLWDPAPLQRAFNETQTLFRHYRFPDVDYDRYGPEGAEVQVAIGVREFYAEGLPEANRTWQTLRLNPNYIRGMGAAVAPAPHALENEGEPELWVRNLRPVETDTAAPAELRLENPSVFFGETMEGYAVIVPGRDSAFLGEPGVDYPAGVPLSSFFRVLAFAWRFGDETLLFSGEVSRDSRMIFRRGLHERVREVVPFLLWDEDPLPVIHEGRIVWMIDGYTVSGSYPLARAVTLGRNRVRYIRNAVKATVDAVTGTVAFYAMDPEDPLLRTYGRLFPELFRPLDAMPADLRRHLRYPQLALLAQAEILQEYHVDRPEVFYAGQDVWQRPQEAGPSGTVRDYRPSYAIVPAPFSNRVEYLTLLPFIARARHNMTAVLVGRNDAARYGELALLELPRDQQVPGPAQVQAMIEQDPVLSPELSMLRQRGTRVDMGQLRVVPLDSAMLYVQPLFLSAEENPIPELWRVVVSDGRDIGVGRTLPGALAGLELPVDAEPQRPAAAAAGPAGGVWSRRALELLDAAESRLRDGDWAGYGRMLDELRALLQQAERGVPDERGG